MEGPTEAEKALINAMMEAKDKFNKAIAAVDKAGVSVRIIQMPQTIKAGLDSPPQMVVSEIFKFAWHR